MSESQREDLEQIAGYSEQIARYLEQRRASGRYAYVVYGHHLVRFGRQDDTHPEYLKQHGSGAWSWVPGMPPAVED
jgi:hypothetical protein